MRALYSKSEIIENIDRATAAHTIVSSDPAYASWPNAYRQWVLQIHSAYITGQALALQEGVTYPPGLAPRAINARRPAYTLVHIADLLMKAPTKKGNRALDVAGAEANALLVRRHRATGISMFETNCVEFHYAMELWSANRSGGSFPEIAVASEVSLALKFGYSKRQRKRKRGTTALTFNQKRSKDYSAPDR